jgi:hypothetical protein
MQKISFTVKDYVPTHMIDKMIPYLPSRPLTEEEKGQIKELDLSVPREVASDVVTMLKDFWNKSCQYYRANSSIFDDAHQLLAHTSILRSRTLASITRSLIPGITEQHDVEPALLHATQRALIKTGLGFSFEVRDLRDAGAIHIRPKEVIRTVLKVREWFREYQDWVASKSCDREDALEYTGQTEGVKMLKKFIKKTRWLISYSRTLREPSPTTQLGPSKERFPITKQSDAVRWHERVMFSDEDRLIIEFLLDWIVYQRFKHLSELKAVGSGILKSVNMYPNEDLGRDTGTKFLQEIGVLSPFDSLVQHSDDLPLPRTEKTQAVESINSNKAEMNHELILEDTMKNMRKDWGDLEVFCIDDADAQEIDDGISIEKVSGKQDQFWVHVHVANPTAFFDHHHLLGKLSAHMTATLYLPEKSCGMLPPWVSRDHFSLKPNRPTLTFSARVDSSGNILEKLIQPGTIRNVTSITYRKVSDLLGNYVPPSSTLYTVGGTSPAIKISRNETILPAQLEKLKMMHTIAHARRKKRTSAGALEMQSERSTVSVFQFHGRSGLEPMGLQRDKARYYEGDPVISMRAFHYANPFDTTRFSPSHCLVQEMMLLAGEVAGLWCAERNVPVPFRTLLRNHNRWDEERYTKEILEPSLDENGLPPYHIGMHALRVKGRGSTVVEPAYHPGLQCAAFVKVTSPLRRYIDMLAHWQIEATLRAEGQGTTANLPFDKEHLVRQITRSDQRASLIKQASSRAERFWQSTLLARAFYCKEAELPKVFTGLIVDDALGIPDHVRVIVEELGIEAAMRIPEDSDRSPWSLGDRWVMEMHAVNIMYRPILFEPVQLMEKGSGIQRIDYYTV